MCGLVSRSRSRRCAAVAQGGDSVAVEFIAVERAAGRGHDQGQGGAGHEWPGATGEGAVGGREPEAADASLGEDDEIGTLVVVSVTTKGPRSGTDLLMQKRHRCPDT